MTDRTETRYCSLARILVIALFALPAVSAQAVGILFYNDDFNDCTPPGFSDRWVVEEASEKETWQTTTLSDHPEGVTAEFGTIMAVFRCWGKGDVSARLAPVASFDFRYLTNLKLVLDVYHESGYPDNKDYVQTQASVDGGSTWSNVGDRIYRYRDTPGWSRYWILLDDYQGEQNVRVGLLAVGNSGNDILMDLFVISGDSTLTRSPRTLGVGSPFTITGGSFGVKKGKISILGDLKTVKVLSWTDAQIVCAVSRPLPRGIYDITLHPADPVGAPPIWIPDAIDLSPPWPGAMTPAAGPPGTLVTLPCRSMGAKKGVVEFIVVVGPGESYRVPCKVRTWVDAAYPDYGTITFLVPKKLPPARYSVMVRTAIDEHPVTNDFEVQ